MSRKLCLTAAGACVFFLIQTAASLGAAEDTPVPRLPTSVTPPPTISLDCLTASRTLPALEVCRVTFEVIRENAEEYNQRITRFCNSLVSFDSALRKKADEGKLKWDDYEDIKDKISSELIECDPSKGDYFATYRARMREYKAASNLFALRRMGILTSPVVL